MDLTFLLFPMRLKPDNKDWQTEDTTTTILDVCQFQAFWKAIITFDSTSSPIAP